MGDWLENIFNLFYKKILSRSQKILKFLKLNTEKIHQEFTPTSSGFLSTPQPINDLFKKRSQQSEKKVKQTLMGEKYM